MLAHNLGIPENLHEALHIALTGRRRSLDLGKVNGEHFAVMAGVGFDAELAPTSTAGESELGRLAYFWTGLRHVHRSASPVKITVDGRTWFDGEASCVLLGNVGRITGGIPAFDDARPDDGWLDVGVMPQPTTRCSGPARSAESSQAAATTHPSSARPAPTRSPSDSRCHEPTNSTAAPAR